MKKLFTLLVACTTCFISFSQTYTTTSNVEILEGHTWYDGKILEVPKHYYFKYQLKIILIEQKGGS